MKIVDRSNDRFQPGSPVIGSRFCGRAAAVDLLLQGHRHAVWVLGLEHFGKTSLLLELQYRTQDPRQSPYTPLYVRLGGARDQQGVARAFAEAVESESSALERHGIEISSKGASEPAVTKVRALLRAARAVDRTVLLLIDEGEALAESSPKEMVAVHRLLKTLASGRGLRTVLAATPTLERLDGMGQSGSPLLIDFLPPLYLGRLSAEELAPMLSPAFDPAQARALASSSGGHPYLTQILASQCLSGATVEGASLQVQSDAMIRGEVLGSLRCLSTEELGHLGACARGDASAGAEVSYPRLAKFGLLQKGATGDPPEVCGRLLRSWLAGSLPTSFRLGEREPRSIGEFDLLELLGQGGMSQVYRARDRRDGRDVALKLLHGQQDTEGRARFMREVRTCLRLSHPNIVQLLEAGEVDGRCFLAMELGQGPPLRERLARGRLPLEEVLHIALALTHALAYAHEKGVVHRDVKPTNILLGPPVKILDFGLAKILRSAASSGTNASFISLTGAGTLLGTVAYMSPEQAQGHAVDERTDQFSLGIVLYEMLVGRHPFHAPSSYKLVQRLVHESASPLAEAASDTPFLLQMGLDRLLQKNPADRFGSLEELAEMLQPLVGAGQQS